MKTPTITVSIPCYKSRGYLRKAVKCILTQTYREFELFVISDADPDNSIQEIQNIKDSRLKIIELKENVGRYAIDHMVVTELSKSDYWIPVDSDDWCTNHYFITLLNLLSQVPELDVGFAAQYIKKGYSRRAQRVKPWNGTDELIWHAHMSALWRREFLIDYNLTNPNFRVAWDSIVTSVPWLVGNVVYTQKPRYFRVKRNSSLTSDPATGFGSEHRNRVKAYIIDLWKELVYNKDDKEKIKQILKRSRNEQY